MFDKNLNSTGIASWVTMSNLLVVLEAKGVLIAQDAIDVLAAAITDLEGNERSLAREARELLEEPHSTWVRRRPTGS
jgi:hypothetical protein